MKQLFLVLVWCGFGLPLVCVLRRFGFDLLVVSGESWLGLATRVLYAIIACSHACAWFGLGFLWFGHVLLQRPH